MNCDPREPLTTADVLVLGYGLVYGIGYGLGYGLRLRVREWARYGFGMVWLRVRVWYGLGPNPNR